MTTPPRPPLPTLPAPLHETRGPAGTTGSSGTRGPCYWCGAQLLRLVDRPGEVGDVAMSELVLAVVSVLIGISTIVVFTLT